jgi:hypothetical protein
VREGPRTRGVEGGRGGGGLRTAGVERGGGGKKSTYTTCSRGRSAERPSIEESVRGVSRFLHGWRGEGNELGALGQRTTIREREECGGVKGALVERTAHHLTYS